MKRLTTTIAAVVLLGVFAMPPVTMADEDDHSRIVQSMKKTFEAAKMAAKRLPTFREGMVIQRHRAAPGDLDYNSFGHWLNAAPRPNARPPIGAWAAGPADWSAPQVPVNGAAFYRGTAKGFFAEDRKSSPHPPLQNIRTQGTFTAPVFLYATFDASLVNLDSRRINGIIGGHNAFNLTGHYVQTNDPDAPRGLHYGALESYRIIVSAPLNSDGTWRSKSVRIDPGGDSTDSGLKTGGAWGGNLIAGDEFPASVIGEKAVATFGAWMTEDNGNKTVFLGAFSTGAGEPTVIGRGDNVCSAITGRGICGSPEFIELARRARGQAE